MFCTVCAAQNPDTVPRCAACGARLQDETSTAAGLPARRRQPYRRSRKHTLRRVLTVIPLIVAILAGGLTANEYRTERATLSAAYARAETALQSGDYAAAIVSFAEAGSYGDAGARRESLIAEMAPYRARYLAGIDALNVGDYETAIASLLPVVRDLPAYENAAELLAEARRLRTDALYAEVEHGEVSHDWLRAERSLGQLIAEDPDNAALREHFTRLSQTHSPIVFARDGAIYTIGPDLLDERLVTDKERGVWPAWSPDRTRIAFFGSIDQRVSNDALFVVDADGRNLKQLAQHVRLDGWPLWSPDGTRIAFASSADFELNQDEGVASIHVVDVTTGAETDYTSAAYHYAISPTWSPDGTRIAFITKKIYQRGVAVGRRVEGALHLLDTRTGEISDIAQHRLPFAEYVTWSPVGERLLVLSSELGSAWYETMITTIAMIDLPTGTIDEITDRSQSVAYPFWSPDGTRYAFTEGSDTIHVRSVDGAQTQISVSRGISPFLSWSPDGGMLLAPTFDPDVASLIVPVSSGGATIDFALEFDFSSELAGPPRWSAANPLAPPGATTLGGTALDSAARPSPG